VRHKQLKLGKNGIEEYLPLGELSAYEQKALDEAVTILQVRLMLMRAVPTAGACCAAYIGCPTWQHLCKVRCATSIAGQHQEGQGICRTELGGTGIHCAHAA
jgi:hypothetical protein